MPEEFEPGDLVEIIEPDRDTQRAVIDSVGFNGDMGEEVGKRRVVKEACVSHGYPCYHLEGSRWTWAREWLRLVEPSTNPTVLTDKDFEDAFSFFVF